MYQIRDYKIGNYEYFVHGFQNDEMNQTYIQTVNTPTFLSKWVDNISTLSLYFDLETEEKHHVFSNIGVDLKIFDRNYVITKSTKDLMTNSSTNTGCCNDII
ncbi:hypothetical protein RF11_09323 [Thelohanellus kitauei]|uniref:Uncharacterized protein n=1 Tax=Thelohanellus kitauei TaxID=669202 RepID=A0A0C2MKI7_THEKT|nr:hypothetical protein RF11_09323 [Thelohanellus kitauei]